MFTGFKNFESMICASFTTNFFLPKQFFLKISLSFYIKPLHTPVGKPAQVISKTVELKIKDL